MKIIDIHGHQLLTVGTPTDVWHAAPKGYVDDASPTCIDPMQRILRSVLPNVATAITVVSGTAYFVYLGRLTRTVTVKFVEFCLNSGGSGSQTAEAGLFSSPEAANGDANQTLTRVVADSNLESFSSGTYPCVKRNSYAFGMGNGVSVGAGTHIWAAIRIAMQTTQPALAGLCLDFNEGLVRSAAGAGILTTTGPVSAGKISVPSTYLQTAVAPDLRAILA
jgi:hypothetical protein